MTERSAKYLAVADTLKREILNGKYESHERFPSEEALARKMREQERVRIPDWIDYSAITVMRYESREKLQRVRPANLGQAARIPGVNPADIALLSVVIHRGPLAHQPSFLMSKDKRQLCRSFLSTHTGE